MKVWVVAQLTFKEALYDKVFYGLFLCFGVIVLGAGLVGDLALEENYRVVIDVSFTSMSLLGVFVALFYGSFSLFKEIERKTLYTLLSKSVSRYQLVLGKFIGINLVLFLLVVLTTIGLYCVIYLNLFSGFPNDLLNWNIPKSLLLLEMKLMLLSAMALFFSVVSSSPLNSLVFTSCLYILGLYNDVLRTGPQIAVLMETKLGPVATLLDRISYVLPNFQCFDISQQANALIMVPWSYVFVALCYGALYTAVFLGGAMMIFSRRFLS